MSESTYRVITKGLVLFTMVFAILRSFEDGFESFGFEYDTRQNSMTSNRGATKGSSRSYKRQFQTILRSFKLTLNRYLYSIIFYVEK